MNRYKFEGSPAFSSSSKPTLIATTVIHPSLLTHFSHKSNMNQQHGKVECDAAHIENAGVNDDDTFDEEYTLEEQRKVIYRVDRRLVTMCGLTACVSLLDRTNVSSAAIAGMNQDLNLKEGNRYSIVVLVFFVTYTLFQVPSTALLRRLGPVWYLSTLVLCWGATMVGFGFTKDWQQMVALRVLLGVFEGGFFPCIILLLSTWYSRYDLQKRYAGYYIIGMVSSAFGGVLSFGLTQMSDVGGLEGWRWIFIIEGIITCLVAALCYLFLLDFPENEHNSRRYLRPLRQEELAFIIRRVNRDRADVIAEPFSLRLFLKSSLDFKIWGFGLIFFAVTTICYSIAYFLPIILRGMGFSVGASQCLVAPPYVFAAIITFIEAWVGDRYRIRGGLLAANSVLCIVGLAMMGYGKTVPVQYAGVFVVTAGGQASIPAVLTYQANNIRGQWNRAFSSATLIAFGGVGGIAGGLLFRTQDAPRYLPGVWACMACAVLVLAIFVLLSIQFQLQNIKADRHGRVLEGLVGFRYTL